MPDTNDPAAPRPQAPATKPKADTLSKIVDNINSSDSILIALSDSPSVDELSAAIGLTMLLDRITKHATAIFSGEIPNTLEFLKPEDTLEKNTDSLRDFIIALNKEKADHIRYMIEGDYVRIYITPYRTTIDEKNLEFSHGDYNVDLVIAIDVENSEDLDDALSEYSRIMHDARTINISNNAPGHFADLEWSNPEASSVCEMIIKLAERLGVNDFDQDIATAFLTGIVSSTERFSNSHTTPEALTIASKLMSSGADQQLISNNIMAKATAPASTEDSRPSKDVNDAPKDNTVPPEASSTTEPQPSAPEPKPVDDPIPTPASVTLPQSEPTPIPTPINQIAPAPTISTESTSPTSLPPQSPQVAPSIPPTTPTPPEPLPPRPIATPPIQPQISGANPATQAAPSLIPTPDIISLPQIPYEPPKEQPEPLDQQIQPITTPPDYSAMIDAELAAVNAPQPPQPLITPAPQSLQSTPQQLQPTQPAQPLPQPIQPSQSQSMPQSSIPHSQPEAIPLPPLPMPPAPQPLAPEPLSQPIPQTPEPLSQPQPLPSVPASQPQPLTPETTPPPQSTPPQPAQPTVNTSFQIPTFPQE